TTSSRARRTSGTSTCGATARSRTRASEWASSGWWRGSAGSTTCGRRFRIRARSSASIPEAPTMPSKPLPTVGVVSLGCPKNLVDTEVMLGHLKRAGHEIVADSDARVVVVNTCGFIDRAKEESVEAILEQVERKKRGEIERVVVAGCMVQKYGRELAGEI